MDWMNYHAPAWTLLELPATKQEKATRHAQFAQYTHAGKNADERDAIVMACLALFQTASVADLALASAWTLPPLPDR